MFVCCECCESSGRDLCDELIIHSEEPYRMWGVVCDLETSRMWKPWKALGRRATKKNLRGTGSKRFVTRNSMHGSQTVPIDI